MLGDVVAKISGQPVDMVLRTRIFEPLGMDDTGFDVAAGKQARVVTVHQRTSGALAEMPNPATPNVE